VDEGVSGTKRIDERPGMRRLFDLISNGSIGAVACQDEDRLFRDVTQIQVNIFIEACRTAQVQVITPTVTYVFHHPIQGDFYRRQFRFKSEMAAEYINSYVVGRLNRARDRLMQEGKWGGARVPAGFMVDMREEVEGLRNPNYRKFVIFEPFAEVVREYFRIFVETNGSVFKTYDRVFDRGLFYPSLQDHPVPSGFQVNYYLTPRNVPTRTAIGMMMTNPAYIGHWMFRGTIIKWNNHASLIEDDVFFEAFNLASKYTLEGEDNPKYIGIQDNSRPSKEATRDVPRSVYEGLVYLLTDGKQRKLGIWYDKKRQTYTYHTNEESTDARDRVWRRTANKIDEAITYRLHQKIRATFDSEVWREVAEEQLGAVEHEERRLRTQVQALERSMEDIVTNIAALKHPTLINQLEQRYTQMEVERERLSRQISEVQSTNHVELLTSFAEMQMAINNWELLTRDEQRKVISLLIRRIEIPEVIPHRDLTLRIIWFDESCDELTVQRGMRSDQIWSLRDVDMLCSLVKDGATQLEIAQALPTRKWENIRRQIRLHFGAGLVISGVGVLTQEESYEHYLHRVGGTKSSSTPS
jgi:hypothetical protein